MSFFKKAMASVGIGAAKVDAIVQNSIIRPGEPLNGYVDIKGGKVEQKVDRLYFKLMTYYYKEVNGNRVKCDHKIGEIDVSGSFVITPGYVGQIPFSFQLPFNVPVSIVDKNLVWLATGLDVKNAIDPNDKDYLQVSPHIYVQRIIDIMQQNLGFRLAKVENEHTSRSSNGLPFIQEFEFKPMGGGAKKYFDEIEMVFNVDANGLGILMEIDRKARGVGGFFREMSGTDETNVKAYFNNLEMQDAMYITNELIGIFDRYSG